MIKWWLKPAGVVFSVLVVVYGFTAARTITGFGDSDELIAAGFNMALPHQPGYPLLTGLVFGATHLPGLNPAWWAALLAGMIGAAAVAIATEIFWVITGKSNYIKSVTVGLLLGGSGLVWRHATHLEVFGLMGLFSMTLLWWVVGLRKYWFWWGVVAGLGIGHHQLLVLTLVPQFGWVMVQNQKRLWPIVMGVVLGLAVTLMGIGLIGWRMHPDSWQIELSLVGIIKYFLRSDYSGYSMGAGTSLTAYFSTVDWNSVWHSWGFFGRKMWEYWSWWNLVGIAGLVWGRKIHSSYWLILTCFIASGLLLSGYLAVENPAIVERMYVLGQWYWGLLIGLGLLQFKKRWVWLGLALIWIGWVWPIRSLADYRVQQVYIEGLLADLPENSGLICLSDASCFGSYYYQSVLGHRRDVQIIANADQFRFGQKTAWKYGGFEYPDNPFRLGEAIGRATLQQKPLYVSQLSEVWIKELGLDGQAYEVKKDGDFRWKVERPEQVITIDCGDDPMCQLRQLSYKVWRQPDSPLPRRVLATAFEQYGLTKLAKRERTIADLLAAGLVQFPDQNLK
jgi:hypothetical protein